MDACVLVLSLYLLLEMSNVADLGGEGVGVLITRYHVWPSSYGHKKGGFMPAGAQLQSEKSVITRQVGAYISRITETNTVDLPVAVKKCDRFALSCATVASTLTRCPNETWKTRACFGMACGALPCHQNIR